ncbi:MAG: S1-like domain-containing RNA-binding protein [Spirochaetaceae bacterium]|jgi:predicted RNA-binding protein (virulence factor B family)|nr:S1-like domain-containing RNA-binding protein [Spirochaetaceae bacterium]
MLKIGNYNTLLIKKIEKSKAWLEDSKIELEMPYIELPEGAQEGDQIKVFVFNKDKDTLGITTHEPFATVDQFAYLSVTGLIDSGAFLYWGLKKDLYLPQGSMLQDVKMGERVLVRITLNYEKTAIIADGNWGKYIEKAELEEGLKVSLLTMETSDLGTRVIVEDKYIGLIYKSEVYKTPEPGRKMTGYVIKTREDGKLDISFKRKGWDSVLDSRDVVLDALNKSGGFLPLHDKSDPEIIRNRLNISKKIFKKVAGTLYKEGVIIISEKGIELK